MRDGVVLAADAHLPARNGQPLTERVPALLTRTPYDKRAPGHEARAAFFAKHGYAVVVQDVRGRYASEGEFYPFRNEAEDGFDTVEWVAAQPWCDGQVGMLGESYEAAVQSATACLNPPHLSAIIPSYGPFSYFHHAMRHNGVLELRFIAYAFLMASSGREARANPDVAAALDEAHGRIWKWLDRFPLRPGETPLHLAPSLEQWVLDISANILYNDYWRTPGYGCQPYIEQHAHIPTLIIGGWYDSYARSAVEYYAALRRGGHENVSLIMGPWEHASRGGDAVVGDAFFPRDSGRPDYLDIHLEWFDRWLRGRDPAWVRSSTVHYFIMGGGTGADGPDAWLRPGGEWRAAADWPPPDYEATPLYFHRNGVLSPVPPAVKEAQGTSYRFNPDDPVPTIGGNLSSIPMPVGIFDQRNDPRFPTSHGSLPLSSRPDVLCFQTPTLDRPVEIAGPVSIRLWVSTDGPDTDFTAKLIDVYPPSPTYPDGYAANLTDSIARLRFRDGYEAEKLAEPGRVYELAFELYPTANRFAAGHRIRVDISSSNYPRFEINPNTGEPIGEERRTHTAENHLYHDRSRPSHIVLPVRRGDDIDLELP